MSFWEENGEIFSQGAADDLEKATFKFMSTSLRFFDMSFSKIKL